MKTRKALESKKNALRGGVALLAATTCLAALADNAYLAVVDPNQSSSYNNSANCLMLQRLSYGPKHPPAEVYLDLPKPKPLMEGTGK